MTQKIDIIRELGEAELLRPRALNEGLVANDRAKYYLTLLQSARGLADEPDRVLPDLHSERVAADVEDGWLDEVIPASRLQPDGNYAIPRAGEIHRRLVGSVAAMLDGIAVASGEPGGAQPKAFASRLQALTAPVPGLESDVVSGTYLDEIAAADRDGADSLHLLIMDAHRELNRLQGSLATETVDGAAAYGIEDFDRELIGAFMRGIGATARLKFGHPGLGTTATRVRDRLVIQNDIGTTETHVLVIHVQDDGTTILTYSDEHLERLLFFQALLESFEVTWSDTISKHGGARADLHLHHLATGIHRARDAGELKRYLEFLGSRIVFLIDWNRARKRLRSLVGNREAVELLRWAADHNYGHMAFLKMGGERLVYDTIEFVAKLPARLGQPLSEVLGMADTVAVLRVALRATASGLIAGKSPLEIRDELLAELIKHVRTARQEILEVAAEHASLVVEAAMGVAEGLLRIGAGEDAGFGVRSASRCAVWEHRADEMVNRVRLMVTRADAEQLFETLVATGDDAIDELEEAAFMLTLLPEGGRRPPVLGSLRLLADLVVRGTQEHLKAIEIARQLQPGSGDLEDFLRGVDAVMNLEHAADDANRKAKRAALGHSTDCRELQVVLEMVRNLERASDALMRSAVVARQLVLEERLRA